MGNVKYWLEKLRESAFSAAPIAVTILAFFLVLRFALPGDFIDEAYFLADSDLLSFGIAVLMIVLGMTLFNVGTEQSMSEIGTQIGGSLMKKKNFFFVVAMTFVLGVLVTVAEPDLSVLSSQIGVDEAIIVWTIGIGVGAFLVVGVIRVLYAKNLNTLFLAFYGLAFALIYLIDPRFLPICFDSGGVTTGPVTVPFLLGFGLGCAASHHGKDSGDSFGLTALCSVGPILAVILIAMIMKSMGKELPLMSQYVDPLSKLSGDVQQNFSHALLSSLSSVALSVGPILLFFLIYNFCFLRLKWTKIFRIVLGMGITYCGLVLFLSAVEAGFMPIASKLGQGLGSKSNLFYLAVLLGACFGIFGVLAEPAVHVLVHQIEDVSEGAIRSRAVLLVLASSIGVAVILHLLRSHFEFSIAYYLIPGYILAFVLSFLVPPIYTAMAFDSGGVASGPMTSTFVLPFCIGFAYAQGQDVYLYGFGLVSLVAMMPLIVLQALGLISKMKQSAALSKARRRLVEEDDDQIVHFQWEE
ncbi:MAG: DUF1538 domain-containing protein [Candidatus Enteromonas sp.]|nr:DUF1538 domain-containing protein [Candidatus Enteromonas sp.]MDY6093835.1 DUF1538 domain-containing protein [Candidatus Enteromonas sp.]